MADKNTFNPNIQTLRGLSVLLVIFYHFFDFPKTGGALGVGVFFCVSGYVITNVLIKEFSKNQEINILNFYLRRAKRLLPVLFLVLLLTSLIYFGISNFTFIEVPLSQMLYSSLVCAFYLGNIYGFLGLGSNDLFLPIAHFWSLAVEEQFYLVYPIAVIAIFRKTKKSQIRLFAMVILFSFSIQVLSSIAHVTIWTLPITYLETLGFGCLWAIVSSRQSISISPKITKLLWVVLFLLIGLLEYFDLAQESLFGFGYSIYSGVEIGLFVLWLQAPILGKSKILFYFGEISYSLYCLHFPILCAIATVSNGEMSSSLNFELGLIGIVVSIMVSHLSRFKIEKLFWQPAHKSD